jgi:hypothetical protein
MPPSFRPPYARASVELGVGGGWGGSWWRGGGREKTVAAAAWRRLPATEVAVGQAELVLTAVAAGGGGRGPPQRRLSAPSAVLCLSRRGAPRGAGGTTRRWRTRRRRRRCDCHCRRPASRSTRRPRRRSQAVELGAGLFVGAKAAAAAFSPRGGVGSRPRRGLGRREAARGGGRAGRPGQLLLSGGRGGLVSCCSSRARPAAPRGPRGRPAPPRPAPRSLGSAPLCLRCHPTAGRARPCCA